MNVGKRFYKLMLPYYWVYDSPGNLFFINIMKERFDFLASDIIFL